MRHSLSGPGPTAARRPSVVGPALLLCLFAAALPARLAGRTSGPSSEQCLTATDAAARPTPERRSLLEHCTGLYRDDVEAVAELGVMYETSDRDAAERAYRRALQLDPDYAEIRLRLGRLLVRNHPAEALDHAERALLVQPNRPALLALRDQARAAAGHAEP